MNARLSCASLLFALLGLTGCGDSGGSSAVRLEPLVEDLIRDQTDETGAPVPVEGRNFVFDEDPDAFQDLLPNDDGAVVQ